MTFSLFQARHRDVFEHPEGGKEATKKCNIHKLTAAEHNYDVSNRELLDMKAALKKWKYCLKGVKHPIQVLIDYHNLEYIRSAKRLNLRECHTDMMYSMFRMLCYLEFLDGSIPPYVLVTLAFKQLLSCSRTISGCLISDTANFVHNFDIRATLKSSKQPTACLFQHFTVFHLVIIPNPMDKPSVLTRN